MHRFSKNGCHAELCLFWHILTSRHKINSYQQTHFVINSFQELFDKTAPDFTPVYERVKAMEELAADAVA